MNNFTERTWTLVMISEAIKAPMATNVTPATQAAERRLHGPGHAFENERFQWVREQLQKEGVKIPMPTGN
jgi:arylsulfatase